MVSLPRIVKYILYIRFFVDDNFFSLQTVDIFPHQEKLFGNIFTECTRVYYGIYYRLFKHVSLLLLKIMLQRLCLNINLILNHGLFLWNGAVK